MASIDEQVREINRKRLRSWEASKAILDRAVAARRGLTAEEQRGLEKANAEIEKFDRQRESLLASDAALREYEEVNEELRRVTTPGEYDEARGSEADSVIRDFFRPLKSPGRTNAITFDLSPARNVHEAYRPGARGSELRAVIATDTGASGGSLTVPTLVASEVYAFMTAQVAMRRIGCTIVTTPSGAPMQFPKVSTHAVATQVANQDTAFAGTNPVLNQTTLNAFDYGELIPVSSDMLEDSGVDVLAFVTKQLARSIGQVTATAYVTGNGSGQPNGIQTAVGGAGTVVTGGSLLGLGPVGAQLEKLIDLQYSVVDSYRQNGAAWLMRDLTGASIRKIRDGAGGTSGQFVWQPSPTVGAVGGQPDTFLGDPVFFDPNVASMASDAKTIFYGDWSAYYIRDAGGLRIERSDDLLFDKNQAAFRGLLRSDGDLLDSLAINALHQAVA